MITSAQRPFNAATNKLAFAQAFSAPSSRRHLAHRGSHALLTRSIAAFRARHTTARHS